VCLCCGLLVSIGWQWAEWGDKSSKSGAGCSKPGPVPKSHWIVVHHRERCGAGELNMLYRPFCSLGICLGRGFIGLINIMWFIQFLNLLCYRTQMVWTSTISSLKTLMRWWRPVQIKPWMDFSVRPSTCTVIQNFCLLHKCFSHHFFYSVIEAAPHSPFAPSVPLWLDERANQTEAWCHTKECHMGRYNSFYDLQRCLCK